jgi:protein-S-isoprenylcysteine O-methyltransferase Ste14
VSGAPVGLGAGAIWASGKVALRNRAFRRIWIALMAGSSGMYGMILAAGVYLFHIEHSAAASTATYTALLLPTVIVGPLAGAWADRSGSTIVMRAGLLVAVTSTAVLVAAILTGAARPWIVIVCCVVAGSGRACYGTAWQALVSTLLPAESLVGGGALMQAALQGGQFIGPAVVGIAVGFTHGAAAVASASLLVCLAFYLIGTVAALLLASAVRAEMPTKTKLSTQDSRPGRSIVGGLWLAVRHPELGPLLWFVGAHCALTMAYMGLLPALAQAHLHNASTADLLMTSAGLGALLGCFALVPAAAVRPAVLALVTGVLSGISLIGLGIAQNTAFAVISAALAGGSQAAFMAVIYALGQTLAPAYLRARVASIQAALTAGAMSVVALAWGAMAGVTGPAPALYLPGVVFVVVCMIATAFVPSIRRSDAMPGAALELDG